MSEEQKQSEAPAETKPGDSSKTGADQVQVRIEVSRDKMEAYLTLLPSSPQAKLDIEKVKKELAAKNIKFGVKDDVLAQLTAKPRSNVRILIASGAPPRQGTDGSVEYAFDPAAPARVKPGEKVGEIKPAVDGEDGMNVFGENVPADEVIAARIPSLINVAYAPDNKKVLVATIDGYLHISDADLKVHPFFSMENVSDEYEAVVRIVQRQNPEDFGPADLKKFLADSGVVYGVLDDVIVWIFKEEKFEQPMLVARGQPPVDGSNGELKLFFETDVKPSFDDQGNVDFKNLNLIQNVRKGDKLAVVSEPVAGKEGTTVYGKKVAARNGEKPKLPKGDGTVITPGNPETLVAEINGTVKYKGDVVEVSPVFAVKGDINYAVGNIDFIGSVVINGDVKSGFNVKATGDVEINGIVEDATIETDGDVLIKMGFIGHNEGRITAKGNVSARYCVNQTIVCEGDVNIGDYVMHSNIQAHGVLTVTEKKGLIVGGEACAFGGIEANILGNDNFTPTVVLAGVDRETSAKLKEVRTYLWKNAEHIKEIDKILAKFARRQLVKKPLPPDRVELIGTLNKIRKKKVSIGLELAAELKELTEAGNVAKNAFIRVFGVIHPGVVVTLGNKHIKISDEMKQVEFVYSDEGVVTKEIAG